MISKCFYLGRYIVRYIAISINLFAVWNSIHDSTNGQFCRDYNGSFYAHPKFGMAMVAPILLSMLFLIPHWLKFERDWKARLKTLPFVILQCYPQIKAIEILYMGLWKKDKSWKSRRDIIAQEIGCLGMYVAA